MWVIIFFLYNDPLPESETDANNNSEVEHPLTQNHSRSNSTRKPRAAAPILCKKKFRAVRQTGLLHEPIIVAACSTFSTYVLQSGMETLITPFTDWYFGWTEKQNLFMYVSVGTTALLGYLRFGSSNKNARFDTVLL